MKPFLTLLAALLLTPLASLRSHLLQDPNDIAPGQPLAHPDGQTLTAMVID
jgi:hypothetical protein